MNPTPKLRYSPSPIAISTLVLAAASLACSQGCYEKTTYSRGMGKDAYQVNRSEPSSISDSKTDPMVLSPPPKSRMAW